ncbi:MAG TPA: dihydrofolate reductase family protein [Candidatus Nanoarchaeia archaeon]|nr:dihydrofolate reductase family protein [Candidatus Nanoarchaeia archaeon]
MKVILYASMSVNGFIARENDKEDFLSDENWFSFQKLAEGAGCFCVGRRAYEVVKEKYKSGYNFDTLKAKPIVLSKSPKKIKYDVVVSPHDAIKKAKSLGSKSLVVAGGGKTNASFMKSGLVDEVVLNLEPFVLGKGVRVFDDENFENKLKLLKMKKLKSGIIQLHYKLGSRKE